MDQKLVYSNKYCYFVKIFLLILIGLGFFLSCNCHKSYAQEVIQLPLEVDKQSKEIVIPYHLRNARQKSFKYEVQLYYSQDSGRTFIGPLQKVSGAIGKDLLAGENRQIRWSYLEEKPDFNGRNVSFSLDVRGERLLGGPKNALLSALVPGLGNPYVRTWNNFNWRWTLRTLSTYALIGNSFIFKAKSRQNYEDYQKFETVEEVQNAYRLANRQDKIAKTSAILAGLIWAVDIVQVAIKGQRNIKEQKKLLELPQNKGISTQIGFRADPISGFPMFSLKLHFHK